MKRSSYQRHTEPCRLCGNEKVHGRGLCSACYQRECYRADPERARANSRRYEERHREHRRAKSLAYARSHRAEINERRQRHSESRYYENMRPIVEAHFGGRCADCGAEKGNRKGHALHIHHVDGSGIADMATRAIGDPNNALENLVLLCSSCHSKRHHQERDAGKRETKPCAECGRPFSYRVATQQRCCSKSCALRLRHRDRRLAICA